MGQAHDLDELLVGDGFVAPEHQLGGGIFFGDALELRLELVELAGRQRQFGVLIILQLQLLQRAQLRLAPLAAAADAVDECFFVGELLLSLTGLSSNPTRRAAAARCSSATYSWCPI